VTPARAAEILCYAASKGKRLPQVKCQGLLQKATSFASAQELRSALGSRTVKLFQSLSELEKEKTGTFTGSEALLLLMHAATMEFLESMSKSHERALFQGLQQEPYAALMGKEECGVANSLAQASLSEYAMEQLAKMAGRGLVPKEEMETSLRRTASSAKSLTDITHLAKCLKFGNFPRTLCVELHETCAAQIARTGGFRADVARHVQKCTKLGVPEAMDPVLCHLQAMGGLERFAAEGAAGCAVFLVGAAERLGAPDLLSVELYKDLSKVSLGELCTCLSALSSKDCPVKDSPLKMRMLTEAISKAQRENAAEAISAQQAMGLAQAAGKNLKQLQKSPVILKAVEQGSISESLMLAQLFSEQNLASGAVFAVSAAQLLRLLDAERAAFGEVLVHLRNALKLLKPGLLQMPGLVDSIAAYQPLRDIVKSARTNDLLLTEVCGYLLSQHHQAAPFPPEQVRILDQLSSTKRSWTLEEIEDKACFHQAMRGVKRELGPLWLEALLLQSKSWQWTGGRNWVRKPSNDAAVALAEELCNVPMQNRGLIPTRLPKIALLMRVVGASEELACLPGLYAITGNHDGRPVYQRFVPAQEQAVRIYWWQEDSTWWIGPEVGGDLVWASNRSSGSVAPRRNWNWEANAPLAQNSVIKAFHVEASTEAKPPPVVRPAPEREGANARTKKILLVKDPHASGKVAKQGSKQEQDLHTAGAGHVSGEKAQSPKRQRVAEASDPKRAKHLKDGAEQLKNWLASFDGSGSFLNMYLKALSSNFDDLCQVRAAFNNIPNAPPLKRIDPAFFTVIGVEKTGHKLTFAKKIAELQAS